MSENYNNFENQSEKIINFQLENFNPDEESYSIFDDYLL